MNVSSVLQSSAAAQERSLQITRKASGQSFDQPASDKGATSQTPLLKGLNVVSRIETVLPDGKKLSVFRFDLGVGDLASSPTVTAEADRRNDDQMLDAFRQLEAYFSDSNKSKGIELQGTAAIDLRA